MKRTTKPTSKNEAPKKKMGWNGKRRKPKRKKIGRKPKPSATPKLKKNLKLKDGNSIIKPVEWFDTLDKLELVLKPKQLMFAKYYVRYGNATQSAKLAGYSAKSAVWSGYELTSNPYIKKYIDLSNADIATALGFSKISFVSQLFEMFTADITDLFDEDWITRKDLKVLKTEHPALARSLQEVSTKVSRELDIHKTPIEVEYVKVKLPDKIRTGQEISKLLGWYEVERKSITTEQPLFPDII